MPSPKTKYSYSIKRGANPGGCGGGGGGGGGRNMTTNRDYSVNLSVQQVLSLWVQGTTLQHFTEMWYWVFLWCLFSSLFVHGAVGLLMLVMLQRHKRGRLITLVLVSVGFLASLSGGVITSFKSKCGRTEQRQQAEPSRSEGQAQQWQGCTAWQERTWHHWRLWCSVWVRPPSLSSYPFHASWLLCEVKPTPVAETRANEETFGFSSWSGLWKERRNFSGPLSMVAGETSLLCYCHNYTAI
ncbi:Transmembrane protein 170B [Larimichthys crocea]|uniref:Uncharacterized protein n=1 Tax=Larimichthys crocea TaxID=215358 RepID=A0ACD3RGY7_LARCR|nr:Transmembrane protein 170B [Larimichthys crocea]